MWVAQKVSSWMAAVRKKLLGLLYTAAAKQGRPTFSGTHHSPSPAQRRFLCFWLQQHGAGEHAPLNSPPFCNPRASSHPLTSPEYAHYLTLASAICAPSSLIRNPLPPSLLPLGASSLYCPTLGLPSSCRILYSTGVKNPKHTDISDPSSPESISKNTRESTSENDRTILHKHALEKEDQSMKVQSPWMSDEVINWPNAISFGRLLSGPFLAWLIVEGLLQPAAVGLVIAGASDWLDGYIARGRGIDSVFGTYLDPLADKVLIGCVALSMAHEGYLPLGLVALVIARDAALIGGSFIHRAHSMKWQVSSLQDFFNVMNGAVQKVTPLYISKINTVFQLALVGVALIQPAFGFKDTYSLVPLLSWCVAFTTCASSVGYGWKLFSRSH